MEKKDYLISDRKIFIILTIIIFIIYSNTLNLGFFSDDFIGLHRYDKLGLKGFLTNFNDAFFMPVSYFFQVLELLVFRNNYSSYKILNLLIFSSISFIMYLNMKIILDFMFYQKSKVISFFVSVFFAISPFQTEVVNWYSSQAYLFSTLFFLIAFYFYLRYSISAKSIYYFSFIVFIILSVFSKEITLIFPLIILSFDFLIFKKNLKHVVYNQLIFLFILGLYFIIRKIAIGDFIGGYGTQIHLNFSIKLIMFNFYAYFSKFIFFSRYFNKYVKILISIIFIIFLFYGFIKNISKSNVLIFVFLLFIISLLPIINLETSFLDSIQSDRYGFFPSIFISVFFVLIIENYFNSKKTFCYLAFIIFELGLLISTNLFWVQAKDIRDNYINGFNKIKKNKDILILNKPDNFKGVYVFRNGLSYFDNFRNVQIVSTNEIRDKGSIFKINHQKNKIEFTIIENKFYSNVIIDDDYKSYLSSNNTTLNVVLKSRKDIYFFDNYKFVKVK